MHSSHDAPACRACYAPLLCLTLLAALPRQPGALTPRHAPPSPATLSLSHTHAPPSCPQPRFFDFEKLAEVTRVVAENLNKIIDVNYYPVEAARNSNMRHRPIGIGVQVGTQGKGGGAPARSGPTAQARPACQPG